MQEQHRHPRSPTNRSSRKVSGRTQLRLVPCSGLQSVHGVIARYLPGRLPEMSLPLCRPQWEPKGQTWGILRHPPAPMGAAAPQEAPSHQGFPSALPWPSPRGCPEGAKLGQWLWVPQTLCGCRGYPGLPGSAAHPHPSPGWLRAGLQHRFPPRNEEEPRQPPSAASRACALTPITSNEAGRAWSISTVRMGHRSVWPCPEARAGQSRHSCSSFCWPKISFWERATNSPCCTPWG